MRHRIALTLLIGWLLGLGSGVVLGNEYRMLGPGTCERWRNGYTQIAPWRVVPNQGNLCYVTTPRLSAWAENVSDSVALLLHP